ncbi:MAG: CsgG/HfaB family protein [Desulfobacterales bacterium]|nr:CsgG/HfaB family protein [Desulfobacterales bacterium]
MYQFLPARDPVQLRKKPRVRNKTGLAHSGFSPDRIRSRGCSQVQGIYDYAGMALLRTGRFTVVDRSAVDQILREQEFSYSGVVDQATAVQLGRLLGAEAVMMVSITSVSHDEFWSDTPEQRDAELHLRSSRLETSEILYTAVGQGSDFDGSRRRPQIRA